MMPPPPVLRVEAEADRSAVEHVHRLAFRGEDEPRLVRELRASEAFVPELSLVAEMDGEIVGHILFTRLQIRGEGTRSPGLALAPVGVLPEHQRSGVGSALVRHGLDEARRLGHGVVVVLGHAEYYPRFGFTPADERGIEPPFDCPREAFLVLELARGALEGVRGVVEYPPPFGL